MKNGKRLVFGTLASLLVALSGDATAADGCPLAFTKNARKLLGSSLYASRCKLATCVPIGTQADSFWINWSTMTVVWDYVYKADAGAAPTNTCRSEVSQDVWYFPG